MDFYHKLSENYVGKLSENYVGKSKKTLHRLGRLCPWSLDAKKESVEQSVKSIGIVQNTCIQLTLMFGKLIEDWLTSLDLKRRFEMREFTGNIQSIKVRK